MCTPGGSGGFVDYLDDHPGDGMITIHCKAAPGENRIRASLDRARFFLPAYLASIEVP